MIAACRFKQVITDSSRFPPPNHSQGRVRFRLGKGWLAPYIHDAVRGMDERESKTVTVEQPYGPYYAELTADIPMDNAPAGLKKGDKVKLSNGMNAWIKNVDQAKQVVTIDANAPFAGRTVTVNVAVEVGASHDLTCVFVRLGLSNPFHIISLSGRPWSPWSRAASRLCTWRRGASGASNSPCNGRAGWWDRLLGTRRGRKETPATRKCAAVRGMGFVLCLNLA